ncbi:phasin family protein [Duganella sp. LX20W]|uniref:Phasin family protein n=1 Tax=Rugamonas brunnea TaxID=2758569 RepID=A0A7W2IAK6_9BURK|nr:phasin family protein [Rugamonas brunnea]MBA5635982.1 phasin family protein [Rugamonas brunnea]
MDTLITPAMRSHCDALITYTTDVNQHLLDTVRKIGELNLQLARDMLADMSQICQHSLARGNAAELGTALGSTLNPVNGPLRDYQRKLADTMAHACDDLARATETHMPKLSRSATAVAEDTMRRASEEASKATERQQEAVQHMQAGIHSGDGHAGEHASQHHH